MQHKCIAEIASVKFALCNEVDTVFDKLEDGVKLKDKLRVDGALLELFALGIAITKLAKTVIIKEK